MERGRVRESHGRPERTRHSAPHAASFPRNRWPMMAGQRPRNRQRQPQDDGKEHWNLSSNCSNEPSSKTGQMASPCHPRSKGSSLPPQTSAPRSNLSLTNPAEPRIRSRYMATLRRTETQTGQARRSPHSVALRRLRHPDRPCRHLV